MNFGHKVAIGYSAFVLLMVGLVIFSFQQDFYLEAENYYEKEVNFSDEMESTQNFKSLKSDLKIENNEMLEFHFPDSLADETLNVKLVLKRPDNARFDRELSFENATSPIKMSYDSLVPGVYSMEFAFERGKKQYLRKKGIYILPR